jgi:hypothetical protein
VPGIAPWGEDTVVPGWTVRATLDAMGGVGICVLSLIVMYCFSYVNLGSACT